MQLHKRDVVTAAATILDNYGIADLTMRRLARELDITPGALYWHFASKQQLLGAVADRLLRPVPAEFGAGADTDWRQRISQVCTRMRAAMLSHTDGAELVSASFASGESHAVVEILNLLAGAAADAGLDSEHAVLAARTLLYYVLGATADEQSRLQWRATAGRGPEGPGRAEPTPTADLHERFAFGLRLLVDGLAVRGGVPVG